ncbi:hypothetical protein SAY86_032169 [Trapa natans]|uniref:Mitochondrial substrate carrier family protein ucpB n=1 Tax=Trapa natans TaxID=22666 RepID=A0AAN7LSK7_TRANT|nr:hypothetical protein SAY86_032169 [Trapa natans]
MGEDSCSRASPLSAPVKDNNSQSWVVSSSDVFYHFGTSGASVAVATGITHPLDVLKVRLQMQLVGQRGPLTGMGRLLLQIVNNEGLRALYMGLMPALIRSILYGGLRLGAFATAVTNPVEVIKVRLQMNSGYREAGLIGEMRKIAYDGGIKSLWKGVGPAMARAATLTASQLATYDESKRTLIRWGLMEDGFHLHLISSSLAGTVSTLITAPMDMVKTRLMLQQDSKGVGKYKNGFLCAYQVARTEGTRALYKGGFTIFARLGPQTMITFIMCEKLRELAGLKSI